MFEGKQMRSNEKQRKARKSKEKQRKAVKGEETQSMRAFRECREMQRNTMTSKEKQGQAGKSKQKPRKTKKNKERQGNAEYARFLEIRGNAEYARPVGSLKCRFRCLYLGLVSIRICKVSQGCARFRKD